MSRDPQVRITKDGPYDVTGGPPLGRTAPVETEHGEPIDWAPLILIAAGKRYLLCRCGRSATKPFCDDSHLDGFDGAEVADRSPRATRIETFVGDGVVMTDDRSLCTQSGFCGDRFTKVWQMIGKGGDPAVRERLRRMVELCPSGRLDHAPMLGADPVEPVYEPSIAVERNGPLWVRGRIPVVSDDGTPWEVRNRVTLCRCGRSSNKPFCDGTHAEVGFRDG